MKRLIKKSDDYGMTILFNGIVDKIEDKDKATDITYGPSNNKEWLFDKPIDNPEWLMRSSTIKK